MHVCVCVCACVRARMCVSALMNLAVCACVSVYILNTTHYVQYIHCFTPHLVLVGVIQPCLLSVRTGYVCLQHRQTWYIHTYIFIHIYTYIYIYIILYIHNIHTGSTQSNEDKDIRHYGPSPPWGDGMPAADCLNHRLQRTAAMLDSTSEYHRSESQAQTTALYTAVQCNALEEAMQLFNAPIPNMSLACLVLGYGPDTKYAYICRVLESHQRYIQYIGT